MVTTLGGHINRPLPRHSEVDISPAERKARHTRLLFWLCYMADKDMSLRAGHTPLLADTYCDLTPPDDYPTYYAYLRKLGGISPQDDLDKLCPHLFGDPQLSRLKETVYRTLYSARALLDVDALIMNVRQLDGEIERWRTSIPADFRPALVLPAGYPLAGHSKIGALHRARLVHLQLEYHQLLTIIHTTMRRHSCAPSPSADEAETQTFHTAIHSSFDLSLEAGRSTLGCLGGLIRAFAEEASQ